MWEFGKIWNTARKVLTKRAENNFLKYLLYYLQEIAQEYPREEKYSSSFYDSNSNIQLPLEYLTQGG